MKYPIKHILIIFTIGFLILASCKQSVDIQTIEKLKAELAETKLALNVANLRLASLESVEKNKLVHLVYFKLKPDLTTADKANFIKEIQKLADIEVLKNLEIGEFKDLGDKRAMSDLQLVMSMDFKDEVAYQNYQNHELHQVLKRNAGAYLAGPPITYDYWTK